MKASKSMAGSGGRDSARGTGRGGGRDSSYHVHNNSGMGVMGEEETTYPCLCGRENETKRDLGWVECTVCSRWGHARCYG